MKRVVIGSVSCLLSFLIGVSAVADDLDIYLGTSTSQKTYNPNVLFIMDTSGSMTNKDSGTESRMLRVQNALKDALSDATNINAGLMRFSDYGGPVLYPITNIDTTIDAELVTSTSDSASDAYEVSGSVNTSSSYLVLSQSTNTVTSGLRFSNIMIPNGALITGAYLRLVSSQYNVADTTLTIRAESIGHSPAFSSSSSDLSARITTAEFVEWSTDNEFPVDGEKVTSPDISSVVQEVIDHTDWCGGNAMSLLIEGVSTSTASSRIAKSYDDGTGNSPELVIAYDASTATGCVADELYYQVDANNANVEETRNGYDSTGNELTFLSSSNNYIGLQFKTVNVPQGAVIESAYLTFKAYDTDRWDSASMNIAAINMADAPDFDPHSRNMLRDIAKTGTVYWSMPDFRRNREYTTPDLSTIVQTIVDRGDWVSGNNMGFVLSDFAGTRGAYSYKGRPSSAPQLYIKFRGNATAGASTTVRDLLLSKVDELSASGYTPIVDTLYEASLYYGGLDVDYGRNRGSSGTSSTVRKNTRVSHRDSYLGDDSVLPYGCSEDNLSDTDCINEYIPSGATYISPVSDLQCQTNNHIVLLSDGEANYNHSVSKIQNLIGQSCSGSGGEQCGLELVSNISKTSTSAINSRVITHTIGFAANNTANNFLNKLAIQSGGGFYQADDSAQLLEAFQTILRSVKDVNATFVSPGVAVNQLNRLTHNDELYYALFKPAEGTLWPGNLKRYRLDSDTVVDKNGLSAVDNNTGFFADGSHSYWSVFADGSDVREGGAASLLDTTRNIYWFDSAGSIIQTNNRLHESNSAITSTELGLDDESDPAGARETLLKWARGIDVRDSDGDGDSTEARLQMGDPIHSQPVIVNYGTTDSAIFVATNHGFLHSFDAQTGEENFAVIPRELLINLHDFYQDNTSYTHLYGLDGDMILRAVGSKTYLYVGMRRGGRNYYVFDVTAKTTPKLVFSIKGGSTGLEQLGQTWSAPTITKMRIGGTAYNVMVVGGGYDDTQDTNTVRTADSTGNAVFIFNADTGDLLWQASNSSDADLTLSELQYGIPSQISIIDRDNDGFADHMYASDMGGQLFRFDIYNGKSGADFIKGARIADFGGTAEADNRHFYYAPDVSEISLNDEVYYAVAVGSGWRASPLNTEVDDKFYMIKDHGVFQFDEDGEYVFEDVAYESDMYDATQHLLTSTDNATRELASTTFSEKRGWMINFATAGEKVLARAVIINYKIFFTTYIPASSSTSECAPPTGNSRAYLVNLINGNAVDDLDNDGDTDNSDRYADLQQTGIAPDTKILIEDIINPVVCLGTECVSTVVDDDEDGDGRTCTTAFSCLSENIFGEFERVQRGSWSSDTEQD